MTLDEFIAELEKTPRSWRLKKDIFIRCAKGDCPITAVYRLKTGRGRGLHAYDAAARKIGLRSWQLQSRIIRAADDNNNQPKLRARLLKACGLAP